MYLWTRLDARPSTPDRAMLYIGPDQVVPLTSILAAIGGGILVFWRQVKGFCVRLFAALRGK